MKIAILGATSYIAKDFIRTNCLLNDFEFDLYVRNPEVLLTWLTIENIPKTHQVKTYESFKENEFYEAIINFVGVGNPEDLKAMGSTIFSITTEYDKMALEYLSRYPKTKYIFLSSGIAYGPVFENPVDEFSKASLDINSQLETDWYAKSKIYCELLHRSLSHLNVIDLRVFNYFSKNINLSHRYFITDVLRAIKNKEHFYTDFRNIWRDYLHPEDFYQLVSLILLSNNINAVFDCYSQAPIDKISILNILHQNHGLAFSYIESADSGLNATGIKDKYYSQNYKAAALGYRPRKTSLQCIMRETELIINKSNFLLAEPNYA